MSAPVSAPITINGAPAEARPVDEPGYLHRMGVLIRSELIATQRSLRDLDAARAQKRAHLDLLVQSALVHGVDLLGAMPASPALVPDAATPSTLAGANGVGPSTRGGI